jgi:hypothetical protein
MCVDKMDSLDLKFFLENPPSSFEYLRDRRNSGYEILIEVDKPITTCIEIVLEPTL